MADPMTYIERSKLGSDRDRWRRAITHAVNQPSTRIAKLKRLDDLAFKLVEMACDGDMQAIKEIGQRLDGMAHQSLSVDSQSLDRSISVQLSFVRPGHANVIEHDATPMVEQASDARADAAMVVERSDAVPVALLVDDEVTGC